MLLDLLLNADPLPAKVLFFTEGVQWVANGSPIVERLKAIERKGIEIIACRSCLASSGLIDQVVVGRVGSMEGIMEAMRDAEMRVVV
jgi:intracellular sulfur oxidation DsrE/DsrF family protein